MRRNFLDDYFGFTRQQRNGVAVLAVLCTLLLMARIVIPRVMPPSNIEIRNLPVISKDSGGREPVSVRVEAFDPNTVSREELRSLGLDGRTASAFVNYRSKGFRFRKKEDLMKVFGVRRSWYDSVAPFVNIMGTRPEKAPRLHANGGTEIHHQVAIVELNEADTTLLETLPAIGSSFARRIVKYRGLLGGYHNTSQLMEVYGFDENRFDAIRARVVADSTKIVKMKINTDDFRSVNKHPYISYELTKKIFDARRKARINASTLKELFADDKLFEKTRPYIDYD